VVKDVSIPDRARKNVTRLFANLCGSSERFALARREPEQVRRALELLGVSDYLGELLIRHPEDLAVLERPQHAAASGLFDEGEPEQIEMGLGAVPTLVGMPAAFSWASAVGLGLREKMALLRRHYRTEALQLGASDCAGLPSIFGSLRRWSLLAIRSIATALQVATEAVEGQEKDARGRVSAPDQLPLLVLGLGRLGLNEFDLASDADLIFVVASETPQDEIAFWTHLAEKTIEVLSSYTSDGTLFAVDTRLRPGGHEGELVVTEDALLRYISEAAMVWEGLTYLKASPAAGNAALSRQVASRVTERLMTRFGSEPDLEGELHRMRRRLEREVAVSTGNTKTAPGGYYDVDFCVSYLRLRHRLELAAGANVAEQVEALRRARLVTEEDARALAEGAAFLRSVDHAVRLVTGKAAPGLPEHLGHAEAVESLVRRWGLVQGEQTLAKRLRETQQEVRYTYRRLVGAE